MIYFIFGASGSGKTACISDLKSKLPEFDIFDFDDIGVPPNADKKWRQESTEKWIKKILKNEKPSILLGQMVLGEILASPSSKNLKNINAILLDCDDVTRINRLKKRGTYGANQDTLNWSAWLRVHCYDPKWEQHVIKNESADIMCFDQWDRLTSWDDHATVKVIDTTQLSIKDVVDKIVQHVASF